MAIVFPFDTGEFVGDSGRFPTQNAGGRTRCSSSIPWNYLDEGSPVELCRRAAAAGKVVSAICHGPLVLAAADLVDGRRIAGFTACRDDVITMGARYNFAWPAMIDGNIVTGSIPADVPEFVDAITAALSPPPPRRRPSHDDNASPVKHCLNFATLWHNI